MPVGSGLSAQLGIAAESTWGVPVTVTKFYEFSKDSLLWSPTWVEGQGLRAGTLYKRDARTQQTRFTVGGDVEMEHVTKGGMGLWWKHALGSSAVATQIGLTGAYRQTHQPGAKTGLGLTIQIGRPQPSDGTVKAHTFEGCKVVGWEWSVSDQDKANVTWTVDGQDESTATGLAAASYTAGAETFTFKDSAAFTLGGTVSTASGRMSVAGGAAPTGIVKGITFRGETPMATERHGLGNSGAKSQQVENDIPTISGQMQAEYVQADYYTTFKAGTSTALFLAMRRGDAGGGNAYAVEFLAPKAKFKAAPIPVDGPDIIGVSVDFECYDDETNGVFQVELVSTDTTL